MICKDGVTKGGTVGINTGKGSVINTSAVILPLILVLMLVPAKFADARDALFLGLTDKKGEPAQEVLEQAIRHEFAASGKFSLIGETETRRITSEMDRTGRKRTERFTVPRGVELADSTIIIRGTVEELTLTPKRRLLILGKIDARLAVRLYFNEVAGPAAYQGEFSASASKGKGFLLFANPKKTIHISATDRTELTGKMRADAARESAKFADLFFRGLATGPIHKKVEEDSSNVSPADTGDAQESSFPDVPELMTEE